MPLDAPDLRIGGTTRLPERNPDRYLPYFDHLTPGVVAMKDGGCMAMLRMPGVPFHLEANAARNGAAMRHFALLQLLADRHTQISEHYLSHRDVRPMPEVTGRAAERTMTRYARAFADRYDRSVLSRLRTREWLLSIVVQPPRFSDSWMRNAVRKLRREPPDADPWALRTLEAKVRTALAALERYGAVRGTYRHNGMVFSEIGEELVFLRTLRRQRVPLASPAGAFADALYTDRVLFGALGFLIRRAGGETNATVGRMFGLNPYPKITRVGMLDGLLGVDADIVVSNHAHPQSRAQGTDKLELALARMRSSEGRAITDRQELEDALDELASGQEVRAEHAWTLAVHAGSMGELDERAAQVVDVIAGCGCTPVAEGVLGGEASYWTQWPGNMRYRTRPANVGMRRIAILSSLDGFPTGATGSRPRWDAPLLRFATAGGTAFDFDMHDEQVGNALFVGPVGSGKAQPLDAKVLTPAGFRMMGELRVGDLVLAPDGKATPVTGVFPQGQKEIYRVTFEDGGTVECCDDHLWKVWHAIHERETGKNHASRRTLPGGGRWEVKPLREIRVGLERGGVFGRYAAVPFVDPFALEFPPAELPIPPYALGAILGDGHIRPEGVKFTTADPFLLARFMADLPEYEALADKGYDYRLRMRDASRHTKGRRRLRASETTFAFPRVPGGRGALLVTAGGKTRTIKEWSAAHGVAAPLIRQRLCVQGWAPDEAVGVSPRAVPDTAFSPLGIALRKLGLAGARSQDKFIPAAYKQGSVQQRIAVLQGLMDTDGSVSASGTHATFSSTSQRLANDVREIVWSLGGRAKIAARQTHYTHKGEKRAGRASWRVSIVHPDVGQMFSLPRKVAACKPKQMRHRLRISSVEVVGRKEAQCISVGHPDRLYVTDNYVVTHNTVAMGACMTMATRIIGADGRIILLDKDHSNALTILANGGTYVTLKRGEPSGAAPLRRAANTPAGREAAHDLILGMIRSDGGPAPGPGIAARIAKGVAWCLRLPPEQRSIGVIHAFLPPADPSNAADRLRPWCWGEPKGWAFDGPEDLIDFDGARMVGVDVTALLNDETVLPIMAAYLLNAAEKVMDGRRAIFIVEEGKFLLPKPYFARRFEDVVLTGRKKNVAFWFVTQQPEHILGHEMGSSLLSQLRTRFLFKNELADRGAYCGGGRWGDGLHCTPQEYAQVREGMTAGARSVLIQRPGFSTLARFDLSAMPDDIAVLSGNPRTVKLWNRIASEHASSDPAVVLPLFLSRIKEADA